MGCANFYFAFFQCSFSNGGHLFAAVHGNVIQLYSSTTFENVGNLKGHNGKVLNYILQRSTFCQLFELLTPTWDIRFPDRRFEFFLVWK